MQAKTVQSDSSLQPAGDLQPSDGELLMQFCRHKSDKAFGEIVKRHGPMVLGVCRQILGHRHDAEDAFQATFLVLATNAARIQKSSSVGAWLHRVAYRTSMRAVKRRQRHQPLLDQSIAANPFDHIAQQEQQTALNEELSRLPRRYRASLVLCYLEGMRQQDAAGAMECSVHALQAYLTRGKRMLRMRLVRRGVMLSAALTLAAAGVRTCQAASSFSRLIALASDVCRSAVAGQTVSASVASLAKQGISKMNTITFARMGLAATMLFALSTLWFASHGAEETHTQTGRNAGGAVQVASLHHRQANGLVQPVEVVQAIVEFVSETEEEVDEPKREAEDRAVLPMAGEGLIGRAKTKDGDAGIVFVYKHGKVLNPEPVRSRIDGDFVLTLRGELQVPRDMVVRVRHAGGGVSHDVNTLFVAEKRISAVGDDRSKQAENMLELKKGAHAVRWELTGGTFRHNLLQFADPDSGELLPVEFGLKGLADEPVKEVVHVGVDERGWPIPQGW